MGEGGDHQQQRPYSEQGTLGSRTRRGSPDSAGSRGSGRGASGRGGSGSSRSAFASLHGPAAATGYGGLDDPAGSVLSGGNSVYGPDGAAAAAAAAFGAIPMSPLRNTHVGITLKGRYKEKKQEETPGPGAYGELDFPHLKPSLRVLLGLPPTSRSNSRASSRASSRAVSPVATSRGGAGAAGAADGELPPVDLPPDPSMAGATTPGHRTSARAAAAAVVSAKTLVSRGMKQEQILGRSLAADLASHAYPGSSRGRERGGEGSSAHGVAFLQLDARSSGTPRYSGSPAAAGTGGSPAGSGARGRAGQGQGGSLVRLSISRHHHGKK